jgi:hypothetical protein
MGHSRRFRDVACESALPREARERIAAAELAGDRLRTQLPKPCEKLSAALAEEARERWLSDYRRVKEQLDEAAALFETYSEHAQAIVQMFALAEQVDREVSRVNGTAPDGVRHRLLPVELTARNMTAFTQENPSLVSIVVLPDWGNSGRKLWPFTSSGAFAAEFVQSMVPSYHPGSRWAEPDEQARRRAEQEKNNREIGKNYQRMTEQQEERINAEERARARRG